MIEKQQHHESQLAYERHASQIIPIKDIQEGVKVAR